MRITGDVQTYCRKPWKQITQQDRDRYQRYLRESIAFYEAHPNQSAEMLEYIQSYKDQLTEPRQ